MVYDPNFQKHGQNEQTETLPGRRFGHMRIWQQRTDAAGANEGTLEVRNIRSEDADRLAASRRLRRPNRAHPID